MAKHPLPKFLTQAEKDALYSVAHNPRDRALLSLGLNGGMRVSEIIGLKIQDIDWDHYQIRFTAKGDKERLIPINMRLRIDLAVALEHRPAVLQHDHLIWNKRNPGQGITRFAVYTLLRRYAKRAGIERRVHPHMLRHTAATEYYRTCHDIYQTQKFLGHSRIDTSTRYAQVDDQDLVATLSRLNRPHWLARLMARFRAFPPDWLVRRPTGNIAFYAGDTVGRNKEFALLKQSLASGQSTVVVSERGGGKSHLLRQLQGENLYRLDSFRPPREALLKLCTELKERGLLTEIPKGRGTGEFMTALRQIGREKKPVLVIDDLTTITSAGVIELRQLKETWTIIAGLDSRYRHRATEIFFGSHEVLELLPLTKDESRQLARAASQDLVVPRQADFLAGIVSESHGNPQAILDLVDRARRRQSVGGLEHLGVNKTMSATPFLSLFLLWACIGRYTASSLGEPDLKILFVIAIVALSIAILFDKLLVKGSKL